MDIPDLGSPPQVPQLKIDPTHLPDILCDECGNATFIPVLLLKTVPSLVSPTGKEGMLPQQVFACNNCGNVNSAFLKDGWFYKDTVSDPTDAIETSDIEIPQIDSD